MNKSLLLILAAAFAFSTNSYSQLTFGVKAGADKATLTTKYSNPANEPDNNDPLTGIGFHVGGFINIGTDGYFSLQPELYFGMRNTKFTDSGEDTDLLGTVTKWDISQTSSYSYISIPLMLIFSPVETFSLYGGPQGSILIGANHKGSWNTETTIGGETTVQGGSEAIGGDDAVDGINKTEFGVFVGAKANLSNGFHVGLRLNRSVSPFNENFQTVYNTHWTVTQLVLGYSFGK